MASLSGPNPLSTGQFQQDGSAAGVPAALGGVSALGSAIANGRMQQAQAGYMGTEAGRAIAQTRQINQTLADGQELTGHLKNWAQTHDNSQLQQAFAIAGRNPDIAAHAPALMSAMVQTAALGGGGASRADADAYTAGLGVAPAGNTFTGQERDLANARATTGITAGATRYAADAAAGASRANNAADNARLLAMGMSPTKDANGNIVYVQTSKAAGLPYYDSNVAGIIAGKEHDYTDTLDPGSGQLRRTTNADAARTNTPPAPTTPGQVQALVGQRAMNAPLGTAAPGMTPSETDSARAQTVNNLYGAKQDPTNTEETGNMDDAIVSRVQARFPRFFGRGNTPDPTLMNTIRQQAAYLFDHDTRTRNNMQASVTQAVDNVIGKGGENAYAENSWNSWIPFVGPPSHVVMTDPRNITPLAGGIAGTAAPPPAPGTPAPAAPPAPAPTSPPPAPPAPPVVGASPPAPAGGPSIAGAFPAPQAAAPPPAPQAAAPAPAAAPQQQSSALPQQMLAQLREGTRTRFSNGQVWALRNGQPVRVQ